MTTSTTSVKSTAASVSFKVATQRGGVFDAQLVASIYIPCGPEAVSQLLTVGYASFGMSAAKPTDLSMVVYGQGRMITCRTKFTRVEGNTAAPSELLRGPGESHLTWLTRVNAHPDARGLSILTPLVNLSPATVADLHNSLAPSKRHAGDTDVFVRMYTAGQYDRLVPVAKPVAKSAPVAKPVAKSAPVATIASVATPESAPLAVGKFRAMADALDAQVSAEQEHAADADEQAEYEFYADEAEREDSAYDALIAQRVAEEKQGVVIDIAAEPVSVAMASDANTLAELKAMYLAKFGEAAPKVRKPLLITLVNHHQ
jgi:hypothetical protein